MSVVPWVAREGGANGLADGGVQGVTHIGIVLRFALPACLPKVLDCVHSQTTGTGIGMRQAAIVRILHHIVQRVVGGVLGSCNELPSGGIYGSADPLLGLRRGEIRLCHSLLLETVGHVRPWQVLLFLGARACTHATDTSHMHRDLFHGVVDTVLPWVTRKLHRQRIFTRCRVCAPERDPGQA